MRVTKNTVSVKVIVASWMWPSLSNHLVIGDLLFKCRAVTHPMLSCHHPFESPNQGHSCSGRSNVTPWSINHYDAWCLQGLLSWGFVCTGCAVAGLPLEIFSPEVVSSFIFPVRWALGCFVARVQGWTGCTSTRDWGWAWTVHMQKYSTRLPYTYALSLLEEPSVARGGGGTISATGVLRSL